MYGITGFWYFFFLAYSFGIETINTFIHSVVPTKTIPNSRPKWAKCIAVFRPKPRKNPARWAANNYMVYIREYLPGLKRDENLATSSLSKQVAQLVSPILVWVLVCYRLRAVTACK